MIYVPMFKNKGSELNVLKRFHDNFVNEMIPLIEIIRRDYPYEEDENGKRKRREIEGTTKKGKPKTEYIKNLEEDITVNNIINACGDKKVFIDFFRFDPKVYDENFDAEEMKWSLTISRSWNKYKKCFVEIEDVDNFIPVITLKYGQVDNDIESINNLLNELQRKKTTIGIRILRDFYVNNYEESDKIIKNLRDNDFLLYDLHEDSSASFESDILRIFKDKKFNNIILNSPRKAELNSDSFGNGIDVTSIDNSLIRDYAKYEADGFGDYVGIADTISFKYEPKTAFAILYSLKDNVFYSFKGLTKKFKSLKNLVINWSKVKTGEYKNCLGILKVKELNPGGPREWKEVTMLCYLSAMLKYISMNR